MKKYNIGLAVVFMLMSAAMFIRAQRLTKIENSIGPGSWPTVLAIALFVLGAILLLQSLGDHSEASQAVLIDFHSAGFHRVLIGCGVLLLFCVVLNFFGFMVAACVMIPAIMRLMGEKRPTLLIGVTGGVLVSVYIIFSVALHLQLPQGIFF